MNHPILSALTGLLLSSGLAPCASALEILRWERIPLAVPLVVDEERVVFIDRNVRVGMPGNVGDRLRVQSAGGAIYFKANAPIEPTRLQLQDADSGALILLDIAAEPAKDGQGPLEPVRIVEGDAPTKRPTEAGKSGLPEEETDADPQARRPRRETPVPVILTRYAAQNLYAPLRTVEPVAGVGRVNLRRDLALDALLPTLPVRAKALGAWRLEDQWVTALRLTNASTGWIELDPRALQGDFVAATFQHPNLGPAGAPSDTTVLYLVTRGHGLAQSLLPRISPIDASLNLTPSAAAGEPQGARDEK